MAAGDLIILDGGTFWYTDANGDVEAREHEGFFYEDVRHLSSWHLRLDGQKLEPLTSRAVDYYSARSVCKSKAAGDDAIPISVRRDRHRGRARGHHAREPPGRAVRHASRARVRIRLRGPDGGGRARGNARGTLLAANGCTFRDAVERAGGLPARHRVVLQSHVPRDERASHLPPPPSTARGLEALRRRRSDRRRQAPPAAAALRRVPQACGKDGNVARRVARPGAEARGRAERYFTDLPPEPPRSRVPSPPSGRRAHQVGDARRRRSVVHDDLRSRQPHRGVRDDAVPSGDGAGDAGGARGAAIHRVGQLARRRAGQDHARVEARHAGEAGKDPAHAVLRDARRDDAVADRARRVRTVER